MPDISNLSDTIVPKSDQLNAEQLLGKPLTITITEVKRGSDDQPIMIHYTGDNGRPYKPCKSMRKVLIFAWGDDGREWVGKSATLFNDPEVKWGGVKVGGIRISHLSHIERDISIALTATKGKKEPVLIRKLAEIDVAAIKNRLEESSMKGQATLKATWTALSTEERKAVGAAFLDTCKKIADEHDEKA
jgi:hypothetical protein